MLDVPHPRIVRVIGFEPSPSPKVPFGTRRAVDISMELQLLITLQQQCPKTSLSPNLCVALPYREGCGSGITGGFADPASQIFLTRLRSSLARVITNRRSDCSASVESHLIPKPVLEPTHNVEPARRLHSSVTTTSTVGKLARSVGSLVTSACTMAPNMSLHSVQAVLILASDIAAENSRIFAKYYSPPHTGTTNPPAAQPYSTLKEQKAFEKGLLEKTAKQSSDVILYDNKVVVFKMESDVMLYVVGGAEENEILLYNVILALRDTLSILFKYAPPNPIPGTHETACTYTHFIQKLNRQASDHRELRPRHLGH